VSGDPLLPHVRALLAERIETVAQLELLIFLYNRRERAWSAAEASAELRISPDWTMSQMQQLAERELLAREGPRFKYFATSELDVAVGDLAGAYRAFPVTVIGAIYSSKASGSQGVRNFADAFRLRQPPRPAGQEPEDG
jgi:hypothetical protein